MIAVGMVEVGITALFVIVATFGSIRGGIRYDFVFGFGFY